MIAGIVRDSKKELRKGSPCDTPVWGSTASGPIDRTDWASGSKGTRSRELRPPPVQQETNCSVLSLQKHSFVSVKSPTSPL
ncbi:hypothetical protein VTK73DRAFT_171 [Phialemonium thermophilum]|uniref:Uncharacterized protein n=1 Tax=Phialemonium thermophilum TaxID=223376 RepID=A0ABR3VWM1_9PEZI